MSSEELPRFVYLHCSRCNAWLTMFGLPSQTEPKLEAAAPNQGWVRRGDGSWLCDEHAPKAQP
ncbi:hypothetical protein CLM62_12645 [Streptomyces sp. SA15]|uniref:hypothetical protein n=1 Tax=Streptomyces sp. SA15 TaxID=934019 RepID=UPI000BB02FE2|nr:hypothetical protein [Streptomyces sp. SA15]PAZ15638.1 hypothetical protein CLM62_12645 [Streptomyces sp. SA15]